MRRWRSSNRHVYFCAHLTLALLLYSDLVLFFFFPFFFFFLHFFFFHVVDIRCRYRRYPTSQSPYPGGPTWPAGQPEHNFGFRNISNTTVDTLRLWPSSVPIWFNGWETSFNVWTGGGLTHSTPESNPCRRAYIDHQGPSNPRESWDPSTTLFAVRGNSQGHYRVHRGGHNRVNKTDGTNVWMDAKGKATNQAYLVPAVENTTIANIIDEMINRPPKHSRL